ncbi:hypothetical protein [Ohtaekwangia koreensis]|uniref:Lipoprotein n=1 Tax=Ohtaekwangia koreensis TaxID=688867 RepID=A0A1T5JDQ5_9BACT|nr:hypothetical protein [Ohtaekwangia koreensis]SKC49333.1 hypothetical protein SAMN05660236_0991 [Ohtaekwangia koreensis]
MKRLLVAVSLLVALASCQVNIIEPRYDERDKVVGYYSMEEFSETFNDYTYYTLHVTKYGTTGNVLYLDNFYGADIQVHAYMSGDKVTIPFQVVDDYEIEGVGTMHGMDLSLNYTVRDLYNNTRTNFCETWGERKD